MKQITIFTEKAKSLKAGCFGLAFSAVQLISIILLGLLFAGGFLFTCYAEDMTSQLVLRRLDNPLSALAGIAAVGALVWFLSGFFGRTSSRKRELLALVLAWCTVCGLILVVFSKTVPAADALSVYSIAESLAAGNTSVIHPTDSYLSYYPQQVGLTLYYEALIRLWNLLRLSAPAYHILKCINIVWACAIIYFQYKAAGLLFQDDRTECIYLLLAGGNLPLLFYTSFVYGEIPSFALFSMGLWALLVFLKGGPLIAMPHKLFGYAALAAVSFAGSVLLRKNSLILVIAVILVLVFQWLKTGRRSLPALAAVCLILSVSVLPLVQKQYELRAGNTLSSGVPAMSYFAMGMQTSSRANGWYNGFNFDTYQETGMDKARTEELSRQAIRERLDYFAANPAYMAAFYGNKLLSQWADGTYACRQATLATYGGRRSFFQQIYEGRGSRYLIGYCNAYQNILYLGAFLFSIAARKKKTRLSHLGLPLYLGLIGVMGGFLFHVIWEANARYIFPYGLLLLPYCAQGLAICFARLPGLITSLNQRFSKAPGSAPR